MVGCCSEDSDGSARAGTRTRQPPPRLAARRRRRALFLRSSEPQGSCSWWKPEAADGPSSTSAGTKLSSLGVDNRCRSVEWGTCSAKLVPAMINANGIRLSRTVTLNVAYTDDSHRRHTVTFDAGLSCRSSSISRPIRSDLYGERRARPACSRGRARHTASASFSSPSGDGWTSHVPRRGLVRSGIVRPAARIAAEGLEASSKDVVARRARFSDGCRRIAAFPLSWIFAFRTRTPSSRRRSSDSRCCNRGRRRRPRYPARTSASRMISQFGAMWFIMSSAARRRRERVFRFPKRSIVVRAGRDRHELHVVRVRRDVPDGVSSWFRPAPSASSLVVVPRSEARTCDGSRSSRCRPRAGR